MYPSERIDDQISKETGKELNLGFDIVDLVNRFQWKTANEATRKVKSIEMTDFGVFRISQKKLLTKIDTVSRKRDRFAQLAQDESITDKRRDTASKKVDTNNQDIVWLNSKVK